MDNPRLRETVRLQIVPLLVSQVTLVHVNVKKDYLRLRLIILAGMFLLDVGYLKVLQHVLGEHILKQRRAVECVTNLCQGTKVHILSQICIVYGYYLGRMVCQLIHGLLQLSRLGDVEVVRAAAHVDVHRVLVSLR